MDLLDFLIAPAYAQATAPQQPSWSFPIMMIGLFVVFYFLIIRPQNKRAKEHRAMLQALAKGDEIVTAGGIAGRVDEIGDAFITVEIASNVKIKIQRNAVSQVLPKGTIKSA